MYTRPYFQVRRSAASASDRVRHGRPQGSPLRRCFGLSVSSGFRLWPTQDCTKKCCHPERSEGSRMVTQVVLFTGFFTASRFRMTDVWERAAPARRPAHKASPSGGGAERSEAEGGRRQQRGNTPALGEHTGPFVPASASGGFCCGESPFSLASLDSSPRGGGFSRIQLPLY